MSLTTGEPEQATESEAAQEAKLHISGVLHNGETAKVYLAKKNGQPVVAKVFQWDADSFGVLEQRTFNREVAALQRMQDHPNIVTLLAAEDNDLGPLRLFLEYCAGGSLFDVLHSPGRAMPLTLQQRLSVALQTARAVNVLHQRGIMHRDIKSLNLVLTHGVRQPTDLPHVKLIDFGLARIKALEPGADTDSWSNLTLGVGTLNWMAPEVLCTKSYNEKVDVWSYGMLLYELLTGHIPFDSMSELEISMSIVGKVRPDLSLLVDNTPPVVRDLICTCWSRRSAQRPAFSLIVAILGALP